MGLPTGEEQLLLEYVNRLRTAPAAELDRLLAANNPGVATALDYFGVDMGLLRAQWATLTPSAPLAWSSALGSAADAHSQAMIALDMQGHILPGEDALRTRAEAAGMPAGCGYAENVFAYASDVLEGHAAFAIDWGATATGLQEPAAHRVNLMNPDYAVAGLSVQAEGNAATQVGPLVITQDFATCPTGGTAQAGAPADAAAWILGVAYTDRDGDAFYSVGEGRGGLTVVAEGVAGRFTTATWDSGGYQLRVPDGVYDLRLESATGSVLASATASVAGANVKLDAAVPEGDGGAPGGGGTAATAAEAMAVARLMLGPTGTAAVADAVDAVVVAGGSLRSVAATVLAEPLFQDQFAPAWALDRKIDVITLDHMGLSAGGAAHAEANAWFAWALTAGGMATDQVFVEAVGYLLDDGRRDAAFDAAAAALTEEAATALAGVFTLDGADTATLAALDHALL
ncbi:CAP domain-containing protein [Roseospira goensis]|uniref:Uncharacterized protein YkwD n=1 Tax=Roseospira goensis TaxID=391922 RepID=A0A7W6RW33_9PROT|nr:CAP domain-containing protein [Roseospira goensis]MBB4284328.1 uncharacterized protein YkwD [Roseospira goensis]